MAENILHSGSFVDRSGNEISITFYKRSSTSVMEVEPTSLSFIAAGETKTLRVSGYTGTLSINIPGAWLSYTSSTSSGVRTYTLTASQNSTTTIRRTVITLTDANNTVTVEAAQAGTLSSIIVNPSYMTIDSLGETRTASVSWTGGHTPTYSGAESWVGLTTSTSGNTMTVTVNVGENTGETRSNDITFTNGISSATLHITQNAASVVYVSPNMISYNAEGGTGTVTVYWTGSVTPTYSISYGSGSGWLSGQGGTPSTGEQTYTFTATANGTTSTRSASIIFTNGRVSATVTVEQAGTTPITITVDKPLIDNVSANGATDTVTVTYNGQGYITPSGMPSWIDVRYQSQPTSTTVVYQFVIGQNVQGARSATITFTGSLGGTATTTVNQVAASTPWTVTPSAITNVDYQGHTYNLTFSGTPNIGMWYDFDPADTDWLGVNIASSSSATVTVGANSGSSRTGVVKFYKYDDQSIYITVTITQNGQPTPALSVMDSSLSFAAAGERKQTQVNNIVGTLVTTEPSWITLNMSGEGGSRLVSVHAAANTSTASRSGAVTFDDDRLSPVSMAVSQEGANGMTVAPALGDFDSYGSTVEMSGSSISHENYLSLTFQNVASDMSMSYRVTPSSADWVRAYTYIDPSVSPYPQSPWGTIYVSRNTSTSSRSAAVDFFDVNDSTNHATVNVNQYGVFYLDPSSVTFNASGGTETVMAHNVIQGVSTQLALATWISNVSTSGTAPDITIAITAKENTSENYKTGTLKVQNRGASVENIENVTLSQLPRQSGPTFTVSPSRIDYPYTATASTLSISGLPSGGYDYISNAVWITGTKLAYNLILTASANTSTVSRSTSVDIVDSSDSTNKVTVPITQAGQVSPNLSVSPTSILAGASLDTFTETITYPSEYGVSGSVNYANGSNWITLDYQPVTGNTRTVNVIVEGNNSGSGRAAQIVFTGDAGGSATVDVYQIST